MMTWKQYFFQSQSFIELLEHGIYNYRVYIEFKFRLLHSRLFPLYLIVVVVVAVV